MPTKTRPAKRATRATQVGARLLVLTLVTAGLLATLMVQSGTSPAGAQAPPYTIEVTPRTGLVDGDTVDVLVRPGAGQAVASGTIRICRDGATYATPTDLLPFTAGNCPNAPISSSGSFLPAAIRAYPNGAAAAATLRVGTGTVEWGPGTDPRRFSLTCDIDTPCRLVVDVLVGSQRVIDSSTLLTFSTLDPIGACGGASADALATGGPDRLLGMWVDLTQGQCQREGVRASTQAVLAGEGDGHRAFGARSADLTYSAVGGHYPDDPAGPRQSVSVPVALNATVIGVLGGYGTDAADWPVGVARPYSQVRMTMEEMATLFGQGQGVFGRFLGAAQARNPELAAGLSLSNTSRTNPLAPATSDAVSWFATRGFDELAGGVWRTAPLNIDGNPPDVARGVVDSFALADPPFAVALFELYSSYSQLLRVAASVEPSSLGPIWVLTDLATARSLDIPTVALQNARGEFVAPTEASLRAAAVDLERQPDGTFLPPVRIDEPGAYPLTFVEHAVAPAEPLLAADCSARTGSQQILAGWLAHLTGPGQALLPAGLVPLTPSLAAAAAESRARVGTAAVTGTCGPTTGTTVPPTTPGGFPTFPSGPIGGFSDIPGGVPGSIPIGPGAGRPTADGGTLEEPATELVAAIDVGAEQTAGPLGVIIALVGLALLATAGGLVSRGPSRSAVTVRSRP